MQNIGKQLWQDIIADEELEEHPFYKALNATSQNNTIDAVFEIKQHNKKWLKDKKSKLFYKNSTQNIQKSKIVKMFATQEIKRKYKNKKAYFITIFKNPVHLFYYLHNLI